MNRTPASVSRERQKIKQEMDIWAEALRKATYTIQLDDKEKAMQIAYGRAQLLECRKRMAALKKSGAQKFWQKN